MSVEVEKEKKRRKIWEKKKALIGRKERIVKD